MPIDLDYDLVFDCCGDRWIVRRSMTLLKRLEQAFGPLDPFARRMETGHVTSTELVLAYHLLLTGEPAAPERKAVEAWIAAAGLHKPARAVAGQIYSLTLGNDELAALAATEEARVSRRQEERRRGPFAPTAAST